MKTRELAMAQASRYGRRFQFITFEYGTGLYGWTSQGSPLALYVERGEGEEVFGCYDNPRELRYHTVCNDGRVTSDTMADHVLAEACHPLELLVQGVFGM